MKTIQVVLYKEGKYFVAQSLGVDVSSFGESEKEAISNLSEALLLYFQDANVDEIGSVSSPEIKSLRLQIA